MPRQKKHHFGKNCLVRPTMAKSFYVIIIKKPRFKCEVSLSG